MANKTRRRAGRAVLVDLPPETEDDDEGRSEVTDAEREAEDVLRDADESAGAVAEAIIKRVGEDGKEVWCGKVSAAVVTPQFIAEHWGGGRYIATFRKPDKGSKRMVYSHRKQYELDRNIKPTKPTPGSDDGARGGGSSSRMDDIIQTGILSLMTQMQTNAKQQADMTLAFVEKMAQRPERDWTPIVTAIVPLFTALLTGLTSRKDPVEVAQEIAATFKADKKEGDFLEHVRAFVELRELFGNGGGGMDELSLLAKGLDVVKEGLIAQRGQPAISGAQPKDVDVPALAAGGEPATLPAEEPVKILAFDPKTLPRMWQRTLYPLLPQMERVARWMPPDAAASVLWNQAGDEARSDLRADVLTVADADAQIDQFTTRTFQVFNFGILYAENPDLQDWIRDTLDVLAEKAIEPEGG